MHEEEERSSREEHDACRYNAPCHSARVSSALHLLNCAQSGLLAVQHFDVIDVDVEFAASSHSSLGLSFGDGCKGQPTLGNHERPVYADILQHLKVDSVADMSISGGNSTIDSQLHGSSVFQLALQVGLRFHRFDSVG